MPTFPRVVYPASSDLATSLSFVRPLYNSSRGGLITSFTPNFDISETGGENACYVLEGELPGMTNKSALNLEFVDGQTLVISGSLSRTTDGSVDRRIEGPPGQELAFAQSNSNNGRGSRLWLAERPSGTFERKFSFPSAINLDAVTAVLEYGVLRVVVPKMAPSRKRIEPRYS
jgi:HSP20 family molecular chaperone IbpA